MTKNYDRLSMEDTQFLAYERPTNPMHIGALMVFEPGPLATEGGGVDIESFRKGIVSLLHHVPRFRQRLKWIPVANHPVWVDDHHLDIAYHVRHASLPHPGSEGQLRELVGRIMSQQLDRDKPLWEYWVIEGLESGRFGLFTKIHHCMMDGTSGSDLSHVLMDIKPESKIEDPPPYVPRPEPTDRELFFDQVLHRARQPREAFEQVTSYFRHAEFAREEFRERLAIMGRVMGQRNKLASSPVAESRGPHRRSDWLVTELESLKAIRRKTAVTLNDVVLAVVAGAFRRFFEERGEDPDTTAVKTVVPVNVRGDEDKGLGNKISTWIFELPVFEADPVERLRIVAETTQSLKDSNEALGTHLLMQFAEFAPTSILSLAARASEGVADTFVTNIPGPQFPLYMFGARMLHMLPQVPLLPGMGIAIGLMSYNGNVCWGVTSDAEVVPDIRLFTESIQASCVELAAGHGVKIDPVSA